MFLLITSCVCCLGTQGSAVSVHTGTTVTGSNGIHQLIVTQKTHSLTQRETNKMTQKCESES